MKSIIDRLEPIPDYDFTDLKETDIVMTFNPHTVKDIKNQRGELLEALFNDINSIDIFIKSNKNLPFDKKDIEKHHSRIKLIEKITGKLWEEIKELK